LLILPNSVFLHAPKTGGTWVRQALRAAGLAAREWPDAPHCHATRDDFRPAEYGDLPAFAFVRHPAEWLRSYWVYKMGVDWQRPNKFDRKLRDCRSTFDGFVRGVLEREPPGYVGRLFSRYLPAGDSLAIGRFERLPSELIRILHRFGESFDETAVRSRSRVNAGDYRRFRADYPPELYRRVMESERPLCERFGYL
jgi:hypothetical protein